MPIYSNIASTLARQGPKTFTHGYAQSLVAATHPQVYASSNRPGFGLNRRASKVGHFSSYSFQNAFHNSSQSSSSVQLVRPEKSEGGLDAYFEAWRKQAATGESDKEWAQFQFPKRIEWNPLIEVEEGRSNVQSRTLEVAPAAERSYSASAVDDIHWLPADEEAALAQIDAAIEREIKSRSDQAIFEAELSIVAARVPTPPRTSSPALSSESGILRSPSTSATTISTKSEQQSQSYGEMLTKLSASERYAEIPAVFEAMLGANIQPTATSYNALLDAAINLHIERIQVVPKALDIYSDMLRRKVLPNTATYNTLISLISSRSIEVSSLKQSLEERRTRFGGMEEQGKFMFASSEFEFAILAEDDRLDLAVRLFEASVSLRTDRSYTAETYHKLIQACSETGRIPEMIRFFEHMTAGNVVPLSFTFESLIQGFTKTGDLNRVVECYDEYKRLAINNDQGKIDLPDRQDAQVYAAVVKAYVKSDRVDGAVQFYQRILSTYPELGDRVVRGGLVQGLLDRGEVAQALTWANHLNGSMKSDTMAKVATRAADQGETMLAIQAFSHVAFSSIATPAMAMLALSVRQGDVAAARIYWNYLSAPEMTATSSFIEPAAMYAVALIGSGHALEGLTQAEQMFSRIRSSVEPTTHLQDEIEEGMEFINKFMAAHGLTDPRLTPEVPVYQNFTPVQYAAVPAYEDTFDPYAASTDFKGSAIIADELEKGNNGRARVSRLNEALGRFRNIRRAGRHTRYITYAKLISAAARDERMNLAHDILGMARTDVPLLPQYPVVRYGWVSILDAMVGACLTLGNRTLAAQYHQELLDMGAAPTANTFGLYITTLKESTKTFDEATEAVKIFHRAKSEGVEPSSFLYNALIGKLGKARRIDDCLFYFAEMRALGIRPTSVTYGTIVNALCRVSDEKFAEELFEEMESMPNYKARPAPYNSLMQFFLTTKRDKSKVLEYYERMKSKGIQPTNHTYKLLVDTHATLEPVNMPAAEAILDVIRSTGQRPEAVHYSALIHAKGCVLHDMDGAKAIFDSVTADSSIRPQACLYQALFESMVANHRVTETEPILREMSRRGVDMTPYIANTLIHGWANELNIDKAKSIFDSVSREKREPSTYEAMTRAYLAVEDRPRAQTVVQEMLGRGYPGAVSNKILELLGGGHADSAA
ncbi:related to PPR repeat [Rhynchosporium agropyri]|uniref:Related to PPR repeat n=1 Tax=Rhynchosporium agropyri TaxID=914238 RepID=A0A1E1JT20_9HELO|nr:related to PPR repeat [Rhynchosporium agropyri]